LEVDAADFDVVFVFDLDEDVHALMHVLESLDEFAECALFASFLHEEQTHLWAMTSVFIQNDFSQFLHAVVGLFFICEFFHYLSLNFVVLLFQLGRF
jgi:hypothetical protein